MSEVLQSVCLAAVIVCAVFVYQLWYRLKDEQRRRRKAVRLFRRLLRAKASKLELGQLDELLDLHVTAYPMKVEDDNDRRTSV